MSEAPARSAQVELSELGLEPSRIYRVRDLWARSDGLGLLGFGASLGVRLKAHALGADGGFIGHGASCKDHVTNVVRVTAMQKAPSRIRIYADAKVWEGLHCLEGSSDISLEAELLATVVSWGTLRLVTIVVHRHPPIPS